MADIAGSLGKVVTVTDSGTKARLSQPFSTANAHLLLRRCAVVDLDPRTGKVTLAKHPVLAWAAGTNLGQETPSGSSNGATVASPLLAAARERRKAALTSLHQSGYQVRAFRLVPDPVLLVGTGESGIQDVGLTLHGTYGWPILRGSTLKGATHAYARDHAEPPVSVTERSAIFGTPRHDGPQEHEPEPPSPLEATVGEVTFLDAIPYDVVPIAVHVMTPHAGDYYTQPQLGQPRTPPAEYHNPVPVPFLAVENRRKTTVGYVECGFLVTLIGRGDAVKRAGDLLLAAASKIGIGAKTTAGYSYLRRAQEAVR